MKKALLGAALLALAAPPAAHAGTVIGYNNGDSGFVTIVDADAGITATCAFHQQPRPSAGTVQVSVSGVAHTHPRGTVRAVATTIRCVVKWPTQVVIDAQAAAELPVAVLAPVDRFTTAAAYTVCVSGGAQWSDGTSTTTGVLACQVP